ncbi:MAG: ABC transporter permease [Candidatus Andersenbacteria bacterium]
MKHLFDYKTYQVKAEQRAQLYWIFSDLSVFIQRSLRHIFTNMDQLLGLTIQPVMFMLLFRYVFGGAIDTGGQNYANFLVAGILIQSAAFGAMTTSLSVATDLQRGIIERFKSLPTIGWGVLMGHVTADVVRNFIQALVMIGVGLLVGFRPTASVIEWLMIAGLLFVFTFAFSWVAAVMGLLAKSVESVQWMGFFVVFPLTFASAAFVPTNTMPRALRLFAENQPITHIIEAVRALMIGTPVGNHAFLSVVWFVVIALISIPVASVLFRRYSGR